MKKLHFGWISVLGLAFWFFLGFPFANHNESYIWVARLNQLGFLDFITLKEAPFPFGRRPLGQAVVWLLYKASGGSMWPQQLFNFVLAAAAWYILFTAMKERKVFSLVALAVGGFFFPGYIYLFHIHGVWYSPVLLVIAAWFVCYPDMLSHRKYLWVSVLSLVLALCYTASLLIHAAFSVGLLLERHRQMALRQKLAVASCAILSFLLVRPLAGVLYVRPSVENIARFVSYRMMELNSALTAVAFLMCLVTVASLRAGWRSKAVLMLLTVVAAAVLVRTSVPVVLLWILICLAKMVWMRKWAIALAIGVMAVYPLTLLAGTPVYTVCVFMLCAAATALGWSELESRLGFVNNRTALVLSLVVVALLAALRSGGHVPILSQLANPVQAEREKTYQLEDIIAWMMSSKYQGYCVTFSQEAGFPTRTENAVNRRHRAPTEEWLLAVYLDALRQVGHQNRVIVSFGDETVPGAREIYRVKGRYAGDAIVYLPM